MQIIAVISFLPVFLILYYIYKKDRDPEPIKTVGIYIITLRLYKGVVGKVKVEVVSNIQ